jgi:hypothetical protein
MACGWYLHVGPVWSMQRAGGNGLAPKSYRTKGPELCQYSTEGRGVSLSSLHLARAVTRLEST